MPQQPLPLDQLIHLIKRCKKNNRTAQKELYQHFYGYAISVTIRYMKDKDEAVEVMNDAFLKVFKNFDSFDSGMPFKPWFRRILINESINAIKKKASHFKEEQLDERTEVAEQGDIDSEISYHEIVSMIQRLPPQYQMIFNLHVIEGFSHEEIGTMLEIHPGTSKSNLHKAKEKLKVILKQYLETDY